jgi:DNA modification methylase
VELSDNEKRDAIEAIQAGRPLPDKYRFLLFDDKREVELVWNGKTSEVTNTVLPFQTIEHVDEPRSENHKLRQEGLFDTSGRQLAGWTNKLIWGDNELILSSLKNGPLRQQIEEQGGIKLIYIDPPFDVGADFSMDIPIGDEKLTKRPNVLEELAYRDTWGKGADSFIAMIYERLSLMHELLAGDGSIFVHCDYRVSAYIKLVLDEIFGAEQIKNEIIWKYSGGRVGNRFFGRKHDTIFWYSKGTDWMFNADAVRDEYAEATIERFGHTIRNVRGGQDFGGQELNPLGKYPEDVFDISIEAPSANNRTGYPTQKPEALLEKIIKATTSEGDLVGDFFNGSWTTVVVAEKLGRKWIGSDLGKFSIHTTRKRMIGVQRELKASGKDYRAFEILNLGKYERQHYVGVSASLRDEKAYLLQKEREYKFVRLILSAYKAEPIEGFRTFHGKRMSRMVVVGPVNMPVSRKLIEEVIREAEENNITAVDVLGFEFEMGLFPHIQEEAKARGITLGLKQIPREVFDKRAIEKNQVVFHDVAWIDVTAHVDAKKQEVAVELTGFSVHYNQDSVESVSASLKKGSKVVVDNGQIVKVSRAADGSVTTEQLTNHWSDWVDYWAVDFDFESTKECIRIPKHEAAQIRIDGSSDPSQVTLLEYEEVSTGDYVFENEWQSFRTKRERKLEYTSEAHPIKKGTTKVAVKVVDIFGNDTMKIIDVTV